MSRFVSADTIVPDFTDPQALNRYSYALGNPVKYVDPSGHMVDEGGAVGGGSGLVWAALLMSSASLMVSQDPQTIDDAAEALTDIFIPETRTGMVEGYNVGVQPDAGYVEGVELGEVPPSVFENPLTPPGGEFVGNNVGPGTQTRGLELSTYLNATGPMTEDEIALKDLVKEVTQGGRNPLSVDDANTILDWAEETGYIERGVRALPGDVANPSHWEGARGQPHIHFPGVKRDSHIPVEPGLRPR